MTVKSQFYQSGYWHVMAKLKALRYWSDQQRWLESTWDASQRIYFIDQDEKEYAEGMLAAMKFFEQTGTYAGL